MGALLNIGWRRVWLWPVTLVLVCVGLLAGCSADAPARPNVLLIVLDDFGYNDLSVNNGSDSPTPTLDRIAEQGVRFTRHYAESTCTPSRVALLTGRYPATAGAHPMLNGIDHELVTLPDLLRQHGYVNYLVGKWHAGDSHREARPEFQGFDHWFGFMNQGYLKGPHPADGYRRGRPTYINPWLENERGELRQYDGHLTDILTDHALGVMEREREPWFMYLAYYAPHTPIEPSAAFRSRFADDAAGRYQALKAQLDSNIGRIMARLEESGTLDDTLIVIVSDNGGTARSWPSNLPFFGAKASYYEGGVRTPLLMRWPGQWPPGAEDDRVAAIFDLYPTIASALGFALPDAVDGIDLFGPPTGRELRWYSHNPGGDSLGILSADGQWRYGAWQRVFEWLHHRDDFVSDHPPDRLPEYPEVAARLRDDMLDWVPSATRVEDLTVVRDADWHSVSGWAFRRTPMASSHTMGFLFRRGAAPEEGGRQQLVSQEGYVDISEQGGSLQIRVDGNEVSVDLESQRECFTLVVASAMWKENMLSYRPDRLSRTRVYVDGSEAADALYSNPVLGLASPQNRLRVRAGSNARWYMPQSADVYLSTRMVGAEEVARDIDPLLRVGCG
jgi:arylsulfatase A-like enzyme